METKITNFEKSTAVLLLLLLLGSRSASADTFSFNYVCEANVRGTPSNELRVLFDGTLQDDSDTIVVNRIFAASLGGFP